MTKTERLKKAERWLNETMNYLVMCRDRIEEQNFEGAAWMAKQGSDTLSLAGSALRQVGDADD